jgi:Lipid A 3-O-deacylase (PagL)
MKWPAKSDCSRTPLLHRSITPLLRSSIFLLLAVIGSVPLSAVAQTRSQLALETGVTFGIRNRNDYVLQPIFLTYSLEPFGRRLELGENWELSHEALFSALHVVIWNGVENRYTGVVFRGRFSLHSTKSPWTISLDGGGGVGVFDSTRADAAQGQDFAFNITSSLKVRYRLRDHLELYAGVLYQHLSNLDLSEPEVPNVGLDSAGPIVGIGWEF